MENDVGQMTTSAALTCKNSVREIRYDCLTTRQISSFKSQMFRGLVTITNDLTLIVPSANSVSLLEIAAVHEISNYTSTLFIGINHAKITVT